MTTQNQPAWKKYKYFLFWEKKISDVETILNIVSVSFVIVLIFLATFEVIGRYFFNRPIPGNVEISELMMAAIIFLGIAYTQRKGGHVGMELFMSKLKGRLYHSAELIGLILSLFTFIVITIYSFRVGLDAYNMGDVTAYTFLPTWPSKICIPIGCFILCIRFFIQIFQHILQLVDGKEMRSLE